MLIMCGMPKEYYVNIEDDVIAPEETLLDGDSTFSDIERPIRPTIFRVIFWGVTGVLGFIFLASANLSIINHSYYSNLAFQNRSANFSIPPARGIIFDKLGQPLVKNIPQFDVVAVSKEVKTALKNETLNLEQLGSALNMNADTLRAMLNEQVQQANVFFISNNLKKEQILAIQGLNTPGIYIIPDVQRVYVNGPEFSTVLGYVGKVNKDDLKEDPYYMATDTIGRMGIEAQYESILRGEHGRIFFGDTTNTINIDAKNGGNIVLNIDSELQEHLYKELRSVLVGAGLSRGAAVIQNPQTGAVLAMVSFPGFDNNIFSGTLSQAEYDLIFKNPGRPLFNRVVSGIYNPGSTIKPLVGLMGLQEHVITPNTTIQDCISISILNPFNPDDAYTFHNWRVDLGPFNLRRSIANSCNIFFASVGGGFGDIVGLGVNKMVQYFKNSFVDKVLGIDLPGEGRGFVPTPDWKEETRGEPWYQGDTYNISIGQGDLSVTPLWLNTYLSAIANGGTIYKPQVASRIVDNNKDTLETFDPKIIGELPFSDQNVAIMKEDMRETILSGTATLLKDLPVTAGAKTGTTQVVSGQQINSLFTV
ncbi:MAG: penicillin-binding transpeptidase domain-containing protein, partial [bacterium]|nr:penicillin-binding transpeptidase domain-containing protein [bacterium]